MSFSNTHLAAANTISEWVDVTNRVQDCLAGNVVYLNETTTGNLTLNGIATFLKNVSANANVAVAGTLSSTDAAISGTAVLNILQSGPTTTGNTNVNGRLIVTGLSSLNANVTVTGFVNVSTTLQTAGKATIGGNTELAGYANVATTLQVTGVSTLTGGAVIQSLANVAANLHVTELSVLSGNVTMSGFANVVLTLQVGGQSTFAGVEVDGALNANGNVTVNGTFTANSSVGSAGQALLSGGAGQKTYWGTAPDNQPGLTVAANVLTWNAGNLDIFTDYTDANNYHGIRITKYANGINLQTLGLSGGAPDARVLQLQNGAPNQTIDIECDMITQGSLAVKDGLTAKSTLFCNGVLTVNATANVVGDSVFHGKLYANEDDGKMGVLFLTRISAQGVLSVKDSAAAARVGIDGDVGIILTSASAPSAAAAGTARVYCDTSGGKVRLMAIFPSGAAQQIAIEP